MDKDVISMIAIAQRWEKKLKYTGAKLDILLKLYWYKSKLDCNTMLIVIPRAMTKIITQRKYN